MSNAQSHTMLGVQEESVRVPAGLLIKIETEMGRQGGSGPCFSISVTTVALRGSRHSVWDKSGKESFSGNTEEDTQ